MANAKQLSSAQWRALQIMKRSRWAWFDAAALAERVGMNVSPMAKLMHELELAGRVVSRHSDGTFRDKRSNALEWRITEGT